MSLKNKRMDDPFKLLGEGLRQTKTRPTIHRYKPHPKQETFHQSNAQGRLFIGGNRSGKTVGGVVEDVFWLTGKHPYLVTPRPPVRGRIVTVDLLQGLNKIILPEIVKWIPPSELINGSWEDSYSKSERTLTLENGSFVEFLTYEMDLEKFAGTSRHFTHFDEEVPNNIFNECKVRLIDVNGRWWMTMTPIEGMTWVYDEIYTKALTDDNLFRVEVDMEENPYLEPEAIRTLLSGMKEEDILARKHGRFVQLGGLIYKNFGQKHIIDPTVPPRSWLHFRMMDHGFNNPTAWLWGAVSPDGVVLIYYEHYEAGKLVKYHAKRVKEITAELEVPVAYSVGDPSIRNTDPITGTSVHLEYLEHGVPIVLGNNDQKAGLQRVARYLEGKEGVPQLYITSNCERLIWEMQRLHWARFKDKKSHYDKNLKEEQHKKDDHACDALRYGIASRPEVDSGNDVPAPLGSMGYPESTPVGAVPVARASGRRNRAYVDPHIGDEF